jgi:hypothetical protein
MKKSEVKTLINDLLFLNDANNPLEHLESHQNLKVDLLNGTIDYNKKDDLYDFYDYKLKWFNKRIDDSKARDGFKIAKMNVFKKIETIELVFNNETFTGEFKHAKGHIAGRFSKAKSVE